MIKLVLLRHGQSTWNKENRFTGWTDVPLTKQGVEEAKKAGKFLNESRYNFDIVFTSVLKRATDTTDIVLKEMKIKPKIEKSWRLNERHYGTLQGLNKAEMAAKKAAAASEKTETSAKKAKKAFELQQKK